MSARFRIRTEQGQELSFATYEMFAEFVRSGDLSPDDVVYDAETKEWASARTHPVVLQLELEAEEEEPGEDRAEEPASEVEAAGDSDLGLELAPEPEQPSDEEAARAFVEKMEAERAAERDFDDKRDEGDLKIKHGGIVEEISQPAAAPSVPPPPPPEPPPPRRSEPPARSESRPREESRTAAPPPKRSKKKPRSPGVARRYAPALIVTAVLAGVGFYFGADLLGPTTDENGAAGTAPEPVTASPSPTPEPPPLIPATEEALRERAQERFLSRTRVLLRPLEPVPEVWLSGEYLATPSDYPGVRDVWSSYLTTVRELREGDEERYRAAYETALDDARIEGEARAARLATGMQGFFETREARAEHYDRVEALATAAIQGHDALVEAEGTIAYDPAIGGRGVSQDPVIEAVGRDPSAQALLDEVLDLVLGELHGEGGPGEIANVRGWVYDGLLDAVTG